MATVIDPGVITLIEGTFLSNISAAMDTVAHYAFNLLYLFATLELVFLGFLWALQRNLGLDKVFFKIIKIGLIFFIIGNYNLLTDVILNSFTKISGIVINDGNVKQYLFNPANIWQYGYDIGVNLLKSAASGNLLGLTMIQLCLGLGILMVFGLLGIQLIVNIVGFYFVSLGSLIMLPFGAFNPSKKMFDQAVQAILKAAMRLMVTMIIIGIAIITWDKFDLTAMENGVEFNINQPLGLFFTALLFLSLSRYVPEIMSQIVGDISSGFLDDTPMAQSTVVNGGMASFAQPFLGATDVKVATTITSGQMGSYNEPVSAMATTIATTPEANLNAAHGNLEGKDSLSNASKLTKSISEATVKKIKEDLSKTLNDSRSKETKN